MKTFPFWIDFENSLNIVEYSKSLQVAFPPPSTETPCSSCIIMLDMVLFDQRPTNPSKILPHKRANKVATNFGHENEDDCSIDNKTRKASRG